MLAHFKVKRHYCGIDASIYVDCENKEAHLTVSWERRIIRMEKLGYWEAATPEKAERYLSRPVGDYPSLMEYLFAFRRVLTVN